MASLMLMHWSRLYKGTESELHLDPAIAALGLPYRFQHPVFATGAILDFAFPTIMVAVEVDGKEHRTKSGLVKDRARTEKLEAKGWRVLRCTNEDATRDPYGTVERLCLHSGVPELVSAAERLL